MSRPLFAISKTDFKVARACPTKLYYRLNRYPSTRQTDPYLSLLSEGGYMISAIATLLFPNAVTVAETDHAQALARTQELMQRQNVTLLEPAFESQGKFARPDILIKTGPSLTLIEVKAKSFDSNTDNPFWSKNGLRAEWRPYIEDVAFQALILQELYPHLTLTCELMMPDKARTTGIDNLHSLFSLDDAVELGGYPRARFTFSGNAEALRRDHFLTRVNVDKEVAAVLPEVAAAAQQFVESLNPLRKIQAPIQFACKDCEYRVGDDTTPNGFRECWGALADPQPHILDLYFGGTLDGINDLIRAGKTSLYDVPESMLQGKNDNVGSRNMRQRIQLRNTRANTEWIDPALADELSRHVYPMRFIDFETSGLAVPYHAGMRPFENVAFQWSCHTIPAPGAAPTHAEWINVDDAFPNFDLAATLMQHLGADGTVFMWAAHENTILSQIHAQLLQRGGDPQLADWLDWITNKRMVDMNQLTLKHYFHPGMKGRTSIKKVVDAIWRDNPSLRARFPEYVREADGVLLSPYQSLPPLPINGAQVSVQEGTGAIVAYKSMLYGKHKQDASIKAQWRQLLLQYCKLDTAAMVMVYWHWQERLQSA